MPSGGLSTTAHGDDSNIVEAMINLPIITDKFAVRGVVYHEKRGGYIDNIAGTFTRQTSDLGVGYQYGACASGANANCPSLSNADLVKRDINDVTYKGGRVSALWQFNDDWNAVVTQSYQRISADGVFAEQEISSDGVEQPALTVQLYNPSFNKDKFTNTSWTLNGRIGMLKAVYTGGYLKRNVNQVQDYTNYARGPYMNYYQCVSAATAADGVAKCFTPSATWSDIERNTHQSHELRFSYTRRHKRVRAIGGLFWESYKDPGAGLTGTIRAPWITSTWWHRRWVTSRKNGSPVQGPDDPHPGRTWRYGEFLADPDISYVRGSGNRRSIRTSAIPASRSSTTSRAATPRRRLSPRSSFDIDSGQADPDRRHALLPHQQHRGRLGRRQLRLQGTSTAQPSRPETTCTAGDGTISPISNGTNMDSLGFNKTYKGFKSRVNLSYRLTDEALVYATWSQGFRSGGFNRPNAVESGSPLANFAEAHRARGLRAAGRIQAGRAHQQRARLEDRVDESSPAMERRDLQGRVEERADRHLRSGRDRQSHLLGERRNLRGQGPRDLARGARHSRAHGQRRRLVQRQQAYQSGGLQVDRRHARSISVSSPMPTAIRSRRPAATRAARCHPRRSGRETCACGMTSASTTTMPSGR